MESQTITPPENPTPPSNLPGSGEGIPESPQPPKSHKKLKILIAVIVGIIALPLLIAFIAGMISGFKEKDTADLSSLKPGTITGPYVEREHYPRKEIGSAIADATALQFNNSKDVVKTTKGIVTYPACTVVTQTDLRNLSYWPAANTAPGATSMSYIDGTGSGTINASHVGLPSGDDSNECAYTLQDKSFIHVDVYQPYLVSNDIINEELTRSYEKAPSINGVNGVELFREKPDTSSLATDSQKNTTTYLVRKNADLSFGVSVESQNNRQAKVEALIKVALKNLEALAANPQGAPHPTYKNSPTFKQTYLRACSLMGDEGMKAYSGEAAAASISEKISNSTGVIQFKEQNDPSFYVYVENQCHRISASPGGAPLAAKASLDVNTTSYAKTKGAQNAMTANKKYYNGYADAPGMGDEAIIFKNNEGENVLIMRKDRFIITVTPDMLRQKQKGLDNQQAFGSAIKPYVDYLLAEMAKP